MNLVLKYILAIVPALSFAADSHGPKMGRGGMGISFTPDVTYSEKRKSGYGIDSTFDIIFLNCSVDYKHYKQNEKFSNDTISGYAGVGLLNIAMIQIGGNNDGFSARIHGDLSIGQYPLFEYPPQEYYYDQTPSLFEFKKDCILEYSLGYDRAGCFGTIGIGIAF